MGYEIEYSPEAEQQLRTLPKRDQKTVLDSADRHLTDQPLVATRNRKRLKPNLLAEWELRIGNLRVYYVVREPPRMVLSVVAVGRKVRNRVFIGGIEVTL